MKYICETLADTLLPRRSSDRAQQAVATVKTAIAKAARGGGYVLSDNHGEIPWQIPEQILLVIADAVHTWGRYPLDWVLRERTA
jgi:hypothetical protein